MAHTSHWKERFWYTRGGNARTAGVDIGSSFCMGLQWPMQFGYYPMFYDGPHKCLHLGVFWFQYSPWGLP